jgi:hypothetical protein
MSFSYSQPVSGVYDSVKDEIRFLVRDTTETSFSLSDEEIDYLYEFFDQKLYMAASQAATTLSVSYAKEANVSSKTVGDLSLSLSYMDTANEYKALAKMLRLGKIDNTLTAYFEPSDMQFTIGQFDERTP